MTTITDGRKSANVGFQFWDGNIYSPDSAADTLAEKGTKFDDYGRMIVEDVDDAIACLEELADMLNGFFDKPIGYVVTVEEVKAA